MVMVMMHSREREQNGGETSPLSHVPERCVEGHAVFAEAAVWWAACAAAHVIHCASSLLQLAAAISCRVWFCRPCTG